MQRPDQENTAETIVTPFTNIGATLFRDAREKIEGYGKYEDEGKSLLGFIQGSWQISKRVGLSKN